MIKKLIIAVILICSGLLIQAVNVPVSTARQVGLNFYFERISLHSVVSFRDLKIKEEFSEKYLGITVYYVFNISDNGFVVVSADDAVTPVLAYSFEGIFIRDNQPPQFTDWMEKIAKQVNYSIIYKQSATPDIKASWERLKVSGQQIQDSPRSPLTEVLPMLVSTWNQGAFYNLLCPADPAGPSGHVWAGCVATAMSQIMYYYEFPQTGLGSNCYVPWGYAQQCANFGTTTYKWSEMMNAAYPTDTAVATLIYHAGVAVNMMYSPTGSGAYSEDAATAFKNNFKYHPNTVLLEKDNYQENQWDSILIDNLNRRRPMYYDGYGTGGHAFNVDGYQGTNYFHFNWGWGGADNGYYYLNNLNPGGDNFTQGQGAIVNLYPDTTTYIYPSYCTGQKVMTDMSGTFEDGSGPRDYQANANCSWLITPQTTTDSIVSITITFNRFETEDGADVVKIYQGSTADLLVGSYSGNTLPPAIVVPGKTALVTFTTNGTFQKNGWFATYEAQSMTWCQNMTVLDDLQGSLSDGSFNYNYKDATICKWEIVPPCTNPVRLMFTSFNTEAVNDKVQIFDLDTQEKLAEYSGEFTQQNLPAPVTAASGKMLIVFSTNASITKQGWDATYSTFPVGMDEQPGSSGIRIFPNPASGNVTIQCEGQKSGFYKLTICNIDGKVVLADTFDGTAANAAKVLDISKFQGGVYILHLTGREESLTRKIVIR